MIDRRLLLWVLAVFVVFVSVAYSSGFRAGSVSCDVVASYIENQSKPSWLGDTGKVVFVPAFNLSLDNSGKGLEKSNKTLED